MSSLRRKRASRANGRLSRGPVTPEGKGRSSQNAIVHGLLSDCVVLPGESEDGFELLLSQHLDRFAPADGVEKAMIEEMVAANWRMRRAWTMETKLLSDAIDTQTAADNCSRIAGAFRQLAASPELSLLHRYETRLHMMYQRALHNILLLRDMAPSPTPSAGKDPDPPVAPQSSGAAPAPLSPPTPQPPIVATPLEPAAKLSVQTPNPSAIHAVPARPTAVATPLPATPEVLAQPLRTPAIPNEPNPTSEQRIESRNRRRLWWRKHSSTARRTLLRVPILTAVRRPVTLP